MSIFKNQFIMNNFPIKKFSDSDYVYFYQTFKEDINQIAHIWWRSEKKEIFSNAFF